MAAFDPTTTLSDIETAIRSARAELAELQRRARESRVEPATKPEPRRLRLTKSTVAALPVPPGRTATYWDKTLTGFGLRISTAGRRTYFLQARTKTGRCITITLGRADLITGEQARDAAGKHLAAIELGRDPAAERKAARKAERDRLEAPTVDGLWEMFQADYLPGKRLKTQRAYAGWYRVNIKPTLGRVKVADLTDQHVERLHRSVSETSGQSTANRAHAVLSGMLTFALKRRLVAANVAKGAIERHREEGRERTMSNVELRSLIGHLAASPDLEARLVHLLLATGARKGEVLAMRWSDLTDAQPAPESMETDLERSWWTVPASVSKSGKQVRRPLNKVARDVLAKVERRGDLVFAGTTESRLGKWWAAAREALKLDGLRLHDLRHVFASLALKAGHPLTVIGPLLGHSVHSPSMTARYSHAADERLVAASDGVNDKLAAISEQQLKLLADAPAAGSA